MPLKNRRCADSDAFTDTLRGGETDESSQHREHGRRHPIWSSVMTRGKAVGSGNVDVRWWVLSRWGWFGCPTGLETRVRLRPTVMAEELSRVLWVSTCGSVPVSFHETPSVPSVSGSTGSNLSQSVSC